MLCKILVFDSLLGKVSLRLTVLTKCCFNFELSNCQSKPQG